MTLQQVGANVVESGGGTINLTGLTYDAAGSLSAANLNPSTGYINTGVAGAALQFYTGFTGPTSYGSSGFTQASSSSGDALGIVGSTAYLGSPQMWVPNLYAGNALSVSTIYNNATLASLGVTPGTYVWTWGQAADQSFTLDIVAPTATPIPAALPLFTTGLGGLGLLGWRRKRKAAALAA